MDGRSACSGAWSWFLTGLSSVADKLTASIPTSAPTRGLHSLPAGETSNKVQRLKQAAPGILPPAAFVRPCTAHVRGAVAERVFQFIDHQAITVDAQPLQCNRPSRAVPAQALELLTLMGFTGHCCVNGEAVARYGQRFDRLTDRCSPDTAVEELTPRRWKTLFADQPLRSDLELLT